MKRIEYKKLFTDYDLASLFTNNLNSINSQIESINEKDFLNTPASKTVARLVAENSLNELKLYGHFIKVHRPVKRRIKVLSTHSPESESKKSPIFINAKNIRIEIPFSGDERLWQLRPSCFIKESGQAFGIANGRLIKDYSQPQQTKQDLIKSEFMKDLREIKKYLHWQNLDIQHYRNRLQETVYEAVEKRIAKLHQLEILSKRPLLSLKDKEGAADFSPVNTRQILNRCSLNHSERISDPSLTEEDFIKIIRVIRHTGSSCERTPNIFKIHNENEMRDIIISTLNTQFEDSTGEDLFQKEGRTAITFSQNGKSVFTAFCKIWSNEERFLKTVNKLLQHEAWDDSKSVITIFTKNKNDFSEVLNPALQILTSHPNFISFDKTFGDSEWHFTMQSEYDRLYKVNLRVMIFTIYTGKSKPILRLTEQERNFFRI